MPHEVTDWDYLKTPEARIEYIKTAMAIGSDELIAKAVAKTIEAKKMWSVKREPKNG